MGSVAGVDTVVSSDTSSLVICANGSYESVSSSSMIDCYESENESLFLFGVITIWILTAVTIYGNCLVLLSFAINQSIRSKPANVFIMTLCLADLTVGTISLPPNNIWVQYGYWPFGKTLCQIYLFFDFTACAVSSGCIILLSLDRYWMVKKHLKYNVFMTHKRAFLLSISVVTFIATFYAISIFFWEVITGESTIDYSEDCEVEGVDNVIFGSISIVLEFALPITILLFLNINVYIEIINWSSGKNLQRGFNVKKAKMKNQARINISQQNEHNEKSETKSESAQKGSDDKSGSAQRGSFRRIQGTRRGSQTRKAAIMLAVLVTVFVICWMPYNIFIMIDNSEISDFVWECVNYLLWFNSGINPILYAVTNDQFRQTFIRIIMCRWSEQKLKRNMNQSKSQRNVSVSTTKQ